MYVYSYTLREIAFFRKKLIFCSPHNDENIGGARRNVPDCPTERTGTKLTVHKKLRRLEELADEIEQVYVLLGPEKQKLVKLKCWTKPQCKTWDGIMYALAEKLGEK